MCRNRLLQSGTIIIAAFVFNACNKTDAVPVANSAAPNITAPTGRTAMADSTIRFLEDRIKRDPDDFIAYNKLSAEYLQLVRETGDITFLSLASKAANE